MKKSKNPHLGSSLDELLEEEGSLASSEALAAKRVLAWQIAQAMAEKNMTKKAMAEAMNTSRSSLDRLLDPDNLSITLSTMERAAEVIGKRLRILLVEG